MSTVGLAEQVLVAHVFIHTDVRVFPDVDQFVRKLWSRCRRSLGMSTEIERTGVSPRLPASWRSAARDGASTAVAAQQSRDRNFQAILRREHDVLNVSLLLAPGGDMGWVDLDHLLDDVLGVPGDVVLGVARVYVGKIAKLSPGVERTPELAAAVEPLLPFAGPVGDWWRRARVVGDEFAAWELAGADRSERRLLVLGTAEQDWPLGAWLWWRGDPVIPPLARYLLHMAKIRYEMWVHATGRRVDELCADATEAVDRLRAAIGAASSRKKVAVGLAEMAAHQASLVATVSALKSMRRTVEIAEGNALSVLGADAGSAGDDDPFGADRTAASWFGHQLTDDIDYLETAYESARRMSGIAKDLDVPEAPDSVRPAPTFGLVTAMPEEFTAMRELLDDPARTAHAEDRAPYVLGTFPSLDPDHPHHVVLTMLVETGNNAAADGCANLVRSFPSVNCVVMIGVAAGVPNVRQPERHVRLGDVVVGSWGVVDYDHVVDTPDGPRPRQPHPLPSPLLLSCAKLLDANERIDKRPWEPLIDRVVAGLSRFARPPESTDRVYLTDDATEPVEHPPRRLSGHRRGRPKVHNGRIGSGDRALRSVRTRDLLAARHDVLALEMEATGLGKAGFSNGLEWFVVRGISDYGDRRTHLLWRGYASLTAAAYTRALMAERSPLHARGGHTRAVPGTSG